MAIIGKIRKHSGLAVIIVGVAIAAFVIGDFGKKRYRGTSEIGSVDGEVIPYTDFNSKVEENLDIQKENGKEKLTDEDTYNVRQSTWTAMLRELLLGREYEEVGIIVSPEELFDQVQGKNPHRYILQYFKDPKTNMYDPALVLNYLKNLDKMEPKAKSQWIRFEKAIKDDRLQTKFNNLISKGYYIPKAFQQLEYINERTTLKIRYVSPQFQNIPDSTVKLTDADYQAYYEKNKNFFYQDASYRDLDFVVFDVTASPVDRKKTEMDVTNLYKDFLVSNDIPNFTNANSDKKYDSTYQKKGKLPGALDSLAFTSKPGTFFEPFQFNNAWYMAKLIDVKDRPDTMKGSQILIGFEGTSLAEQAKITRNKEAAKKIADSLLVVLKKNPENFSSIARSISDYPTAKDDGGELKAMTDGDPSFALFFNYGLSMKPNEIKVVETGIGYAILRITSQTKPINKVRIAVLQRLIEPSNQTYQDTYLKASAFAGQNKSAEAFDKAATAQKLNKRNATFLKEMDNSIMGMTNAREVVRWAFSENNKIGDVSPVFDLTGKYVVAVLKNTYEKGLLPLDKIKDRIEQNVRTYRKVQMVAEKMREAFEKTKDINLLATQLGAKVDSGSVTFAGYSRSLGNEAAVVGTICTLKKDVLTGPLVGNFGAYFVVVDNIEEAPKTEDYNPVKMQLISSFEGRVANASYTALEKMSKVIDNRSKYF